MNDEPIGEGEALPKPKDERKFPKLPGLSRKQTYKVVSFIPIAQLALCFVLLFVTWMEWYKVSYDLLVDISDASLLSCVSLWFLKYMAGFCKGHLFAIYSLVALSLLNVVNHFINLDYYILYGMIVTFSGLVLSGILYKR